MNDGVPSRLSPEKQSLLEQRLAAKEKKRTPEEFVIPKRPNRDFAPLSFVQLQMWVIDQMTPDNLAYNEPVGYRLPGPLDAAALEDSFHEVIRRLQLLRPTFPLESGEPLQRI